MSVVLPVSLHSHTLAAAYLEALGKHHHLALLPLCRRLENWTQHVLMQLAADKPIDSTRAVSLTMALPDNLPLATVMNAVCEEAALAALWQQLGLGKTTVTPLLLPLLAAAWWQQVMADESAEKMATETPWQRLCATLKLLQQHAHQVNSLRLLAVALYDLNDSWQQYDMQALQLPLMAHPQWQRLTPLVMAQPEAIELTPEGDEVPARYGLVPTWLTENWAQQLSDHGFLPSVPQVDSQTLKNAHAQNPLAAVFTQMLNIYQNPLNSLPPLCVLGARAAMEWRLQIEQHEQKGNN